MLRLLSFFMVILFFVVACRPTVKEELKTVDPPAITMPDTNITPTLTRLWGTESKLTTAESVFYDSLANILYVSCIGGVPANKKDGDGFIARVGMDGKIQDLKWVTGLNAPKGMGRIGNSLYVADIDRIVAIDVNTGKITNSWKVSGASLLNDIAASKDSIIYISDSNTNTIYRLAKGKVILMLSDTSMHGTNGLYADDQNLLIASDGITYSVDIPSLGVHQIVKGIPAGDGIERYRDGIFQSNWNGEINYIAADSTVTKVLDTKDVKLNTADIEVVENKNLLFVPTFFGNSVTAYTISIKENVPAGNQ